MISTLGKRFMSNGQAPSGEHIEFKTGAVVYAQGGLSSSVYMVLDGEVDIWQQATEECHHIASIGAGGLPGKFSVIENTSRPEAQKHHRLFLSNFQLSNAFFNLSGARCRQDIGCKT